MEFWCRLWIWMIGIPCRYDYEFSCWHFNNGSVMNIWVFKHTHPSLKDELLVKAPAGWCVRIKGLPGLGAEGAVKTATGAHSRYNGTCWNWGGRAYDIRSCWKFYKSNKRHTFICMSQHFFSSENSSSPLTLVYASFMKARLASAGSRNSTIAVRPDGGSRTLPRDPWGENRASSSETCTPEGKFFTRITELLRWPDA